MKQIKFLIAITCITAAGLSCRPRPTDSKACQLTAEDVTGPDDPLLAYWAQE